MRHVPLSLLVVAAMAVPAAADPPKLTDPVKLEKVNMRLYRASASKIGCTPQTNGIPCDGLDRYRTGMASTHIALEGKQGVGPVVMYQVMASRSGSLVDSQAIAAIGARKVVGRGWIQAGPGIARAGVGPGPRAVGIVKTLDQPRLGLAGGVGMNVGNTDEPTSLALDFGTTIHSKDDETQIYQVAASVVKRF